MLILTKHSHLCTRSIMATPTPDSGIDVPSKPHQPIASDLLTFSLSTTVTKCLTFSLFTCFVSASDTFEKIGSG